MPRMADYKKMYFYLAGQIAGTIESLQSVVDALKRTQELTEEMYSESAAEEGDDTCNEEE